MLYKSYISLIKQNKINTGFSSRIPDYATKYFLKKLENSVNKISKKNFLDIGAGSGRLSILLANNGFESGTALEVGIDKNNWNKILSENSNIKLIEGLLQDNLQNLDRENKYDLILLVEVFEHIPLNFISDFLVNIKKILSDDGRIFLTTPNYVVQGPAESSHIWYQKFLYGHYKHYSLDELKDILKKFDFEIETIDFECTNIKKKYYNKIFYPLIRWDAKFLNSEKLPKTLRFWYKHFSYPAIFIFRIFFNLWSKIIVLLEEKNNSEKKSDTIMLLIKNKI